MDPEMRRKRSCSLYSIVTVLLLLLMAGQASAGESVTTLRNQTMTIMGTWEKNSAARIPFTIDDFQGFRYLNLSYQMLYPTAVTPTACGLVFKLTTDEYFARWKNGSSLVFVPVGEDLKVFNTGFITFDPRKNPEPAWQMGRYWLLVNMNPANCVNEAHIQLDLVRESTEIPMTTTATPRATTPVASPRETTSSPTMALKEPVLSPGTTQAAGGPGTPVTTPTKAPLPGYIPALAAVLAICILRGGLNRR
jgi:hypothetical protein